MTMICFYIKVRSDQTHWHCGTVGNYNTYLIVVACGGAFSVDLAMVCKIGGFPIHRHEIRDFTADCLREVCPDVEVEPQLQPLTTESVALRSARVADGIAPTPGERDVNQRVAPRSSMSEYFTLTVPAISQQLCQPYTCTRVLSGRRNASVASRWERSASARFVSQSLVPSTTYKCVLHCWTHHWIVDTPFSPRYQSADAWSICSTAGARPWRWMLCSGLLATTHKSQSWSSPVFVVTVVNQEWWWGEWSTKKLFPLLVLQQKSFFLLMQAMILQLVVCFWLQKCVQ